MMRGMQLVAEFPAGTVLFDKPCGDGDRCALPGTPWPVQIFWDPPAKRPSFGHAGEVIGLTMTFAVTLGKGHRAFRGMLLSDSGASSGFVAKRVVDRLKLPMRACAYDAVGLADGSDKALLGEVDVPFVLGGRKFAYRAYVMEDTVPGVDLILGDDWMVKHDAALMFARRGMRFEAEGERFVQATPVDENELPHGAAMAQYCMFALAADRRTRMGLDKLPVFLSAKQVRKMMRDPGQQALVVRVVGETRYSPRHIHVRAQVRTAVC